MSVADTPPAQASLGFYRLPKETRQRIFGMALYGRQTAALLVALRGTGELYDDALFAFYSVNTVSFNPENCQEFQEPGRLVGPAQNVRKLGINLAFCNREVQRNQFRDGTMSEREISEVMEFLLYYTTTAIKSPLQLVAANIKTLSITILNTPYGEEDVLSVLKGLLPYCEKLKRFEIKVIVEGTSDGNSHHAVLEAIQKIAEKRDVSLFSRIARMVQVEPQRGYEVVHKESTSTKFRCIETTTYSTEKVISFVDDEEEEGFDDEDEEYGGDEV